MVFQGDVLPIGALLERAQTAPAYEPGADVGVRHTAADNAARCAVLLSAAATPPAPAPPGSVRIDAAFAALADHLAEHDGWPAPAWATDPARRADGWYPAVPTIFRAEAEQDSPRAFRPRGILITGRSLDRA